MTTKGKYSSSDLFETYGHLTFARLLSGFRLSEGLSQKVFAQKMGLSAANLCDLEKGRKLPSPRRAADLARKLGLPEVLLIQVALQDELRASRLNYRVSLAA